MQIQLYRDFGPIVSSNHVSAPEKESQKKEEVISGKQWTKLGANNEYSFLSISDKKHHETNSPLNLKPAFYHDAIKDCYYFIFCQIAYMGN